MWGTLAVVLTIGCNPLATIGFLTLQGSGQAGQISRSFRRKGPKKDKEEIKVALFVSQGTGQSFEFAGAEATIASEMARVMPELAKENKQKVIVIKPAEVNKFKMTQPDVEGHARQCLGQGPRCRLRPRNPPRQTPPVPAGQPEPAIRGRGEVSVFMYDVEDGVAEPRSYVHNYLYPKTGVGPADALPVGAFRKEFLERLAVELAQYHIDHKTSSGIAEGR